MTKTDAKKKLEKSHHRVIGEFIVKMAPRKFEDRTEMLQFFVKALIDNRSIDDVYGELAHWAAKRYGDAE